MYAINLFVASSVTSDLPASESQKKTKVSLTSGKMISSHTKEAVYHNYSEL